MNRSVADRWQTAFQVALRRPELAQSLRMAATEMKLADWTTHLTTAVVRSCEALGWRPAGKGHRGRALPVSRQEYLAIDVTAFSSTTTGGVRWPLPKAVFELENQQRGESVSYSLWKVLCVRAELRVVFAYRQERHEGPSLIAMLADQVIASLTIDQRMATTGETLVVVGHRGGADTFPYGYFDTWRLEVNPGRFAMV